MILQKLFPWLGRNDEVEPKVVKVAQEEIRRGQEEKERLRTTLDRTGNQIRDRISQGR